ncbi:PIN domain-containing protein [Thalassobaculum sp.]|uniref:PIN domain-containing protein n=1 Tax=Thalassobaculum sp. TaxID=2022740 RepID=UPI0032EB2AB7
MRIIVSDTSCLIDLRKVGLLMAVLALRYRFLIPLPLFEDELLSWSAQEKALLKDAGLEVLDLDGDQVDRASAIRRTNKALKLNDCFALVAAEDVADPVLLTGDGALRRFAEARAIEVHGVLWALDELDAGLLVPVQALLQALQGFRDDPTVWLPEEDISVRLRRYRRRL